MTWWLHTRRVALLASATAGFWIVALALEMLCEHVESGGKVPTYHRILTTENKWLSARHGLRRR